MKKLHPDMLERSLVIEVAEKIASLDPDDRSARQRLIDEIVEGDKLLQDQTGSLLALDQALLDRTGETRRRLRLPLQDFVQRGPAANIPSVDSQSGESSAALDRERRALKRSLSNLVERYSASRAVEL